MDQALNKPSEVDLSVAFCPERGHALTAGKKEISVLHVVEALLGGPASYMREILPEQAAQFGPQRIGLIIPHEQKEHLPGHEAYLTRYFSSSRSRALNVVRLIFAVRSYLRKHPVDLIHAQGTFAGVAARLAVRGMPGPPKLVYCAHGWAFDRETSGWKNAIAAAIERILARWADSIICISEHDHQSAKRAGIREDRLLKIVSGISELPVNNEESESCVIWPDARRRFLFVGRFDHQKGLEFFLQAMCSLGETSFGYAIGRSVVKNPTPLIFPANVVKTGWLTRDQVQAYMMSAEVIVMPSRWEGFGLTAVEAMRAGKAVIATNVGGLREIVEHGKTGLLVEPNSASALISAMAGLSDDEVRQMGDLGRKRFLKHYQASRMNDSLINLYRKNMSIHFDESTDEKKS